MVWLQAVKVCDANIVYVWQVVDSQAALQDSDFILRIGFSHASFTLYHLPVDFIRLLGSFLQSRSVLAAENLFLRKQLSLYQERQVRPHRATGATQLTMILVGKLFDWREALITFRPKTLVGWHRKAFRLLWRWKSRRIGRPRIPKDLRGLIVAMARDNPTWGQARMADELLVRLGFRVSLRTVRKYLVKEPNGGRLRPDPSQRWMTFVRNHAQAMLACEKVGDPVRSITSSLAVSTFGDNSNCASRVMAVESE